MYPVKYMVNCNILLNSSTVEADTHIKVEIMRKNPPILPINFGEMREFMKNGGFGFYEVKTYIHL